MERGHSRNRAGNDGHFVPHGSQMLSQAGGMMLQPPGMGSEQPDTDANPQGIHFYFAGTTPTTFKMESRKT